MITVGQKAPEWYWTHGLHDANILSAVFQEKKGTPCFVFMLDSEGSLGEDIKEIRLINCKIKTPNFNLSQLKGGWWLWDTLSSKNGWYELIIEFDTQQCQRKTVSVVFEKAEVMKGAIE